jgi:hypothetical protein
MEYYESKLYIKYLDLIFKMHPLQGRGHFVQIDYIHLIARLSTCLDSMPSKKTLYYMPGFKFLDHK